MEKINRFDCPHNSSKKFTEAHDFDYHYSQKCGNGCGYSHGDLIDELEQELAKVKEENEKLKKENDNLKKQTGYSTSFTSRTCNNCGHRDCD